MDHFACHLYYRTLTTVPAVVRNWYNGLSKGTSTMVNKLVAVSLYNMRFRLTKEYVSSLICQIEMTKAADVQEKKSDEKLKVSSLLASSKMVADSRARGGDIGHYSPRGLSIIASKGGG
jgi:hypothetical protein